MPHVHYSPLSPLERPLLNQFYRSQRSSMRAQPTGELWVARVGGIVAGLCLSEVPGGRWLTGLLVDPAWRGKGIARGLVNQACRAGEGPVWLFCHPDLQGFYLEQAFKPADDLPAVLAERLARYQRSKPLLALGRS